MAFAKDSLSIEKLNDHNFSTWKFKMTMYLIRCELDDLITNDPPSTVTEQWTKRDKKARAIINLSIEDSQILHIKNIGTAKETFLTLQRIHERSNLCSKLFLLRKLYGSKLDEGGNMNSHISSILDLIDKLNSIGETINDFHISAIMLCSLPRSYDTLVTALEARPESELSSSFVKNKLIDEFTKRSENNAQRGNPSRALNTTKVDHSYFNDRTPDIQHKNNNFPQHKRGNSRQYSAQKREQKFCVYCKRSSHLKADCWFLKNKTNSNKGHKDHSHKSALCLDTHENHPRSNTVENVETKNSNDFAFITSESNSNTWLFDSGSSSHITNNKRLFTRIYDTNRSKVIVANGHVLTAHGSGDIKFATTSPDHQQQYITLKNVLYVPEIQANLLSVNRATQCGGNVVFDKNECKLIYNGKTLLTGNLKNNLYEVNLENPVRENYANALCQCQDTNCIDLWHKRMGHRNLESINTLINKELVIGIKIAKCKHGNACEICTRSKLTNAPYPKSAEHKTNRVLDLVHTDLCGPFKTPTIGGKTYLLTFIDDFSRYTTIYLIAHKYEVLQKLKEFVAMTKNKFGRVPCAIRSDNGGEYTSNEMDSFLKSLGIRHQLTVPNSAPQNGVAERKNRTLLEMTRCLLTEAGLPHHFWGEGINTANYLQNRLPTRINDKTPFEYWERYRPNLSNLKVFGCKAYYYVDKTKRSKLDDRGQPGIFTGYDLNSKGYRIYTGSKNITISRSVKFLENLMPYLNTDNKSTPNSDDCPLDIIKEQNVEIDFDTLSENVAEQQPDVAPQTPRRSERSNRGVPPDRFSYLANIDQTGEPKSWCDIQNLNNPVEKKNWLDATNDEINSLELNKTWTLVDPPAGKNVIGCRWTFKKKYNSNGEVDKYKARLVAKGFSQKFGEDYDETYASVVSHTTVRAFLAAAAHKDLTVNHLDVKTAFLHGELTEEIYMAQPEGYVKPGTEYKVCKLLKAIYGLKQAARTWQIKIERTLRDLKFTQSEADPCLFFKGKGENVVYIIVYVDDILVAGNDNEIKDVTRSLSHEFDIKDLGPISHYLGIAIRKTNEGHYALNQSLKITEIVNKYNLTNSKPCNIPMEPGYSKVDHEENLLPNNKQYRSAVGALLYIATVTRPDILASVNILSRRNEKPRSIDWEACKRVIKYLNTTKDLELIINPHKDATLVCYSDADWGGDIKDRKSTSGNIFMLGKSPINWVSKKQNSVALSSAEAEYLSAANAGIEISWLLKLFKDLHLHQTLPIKFYMDNQPALKMIDTPKYMTKTKHVSIKYHYIRSLKEDDIIDLDYCPSSNMIADILTKPLPKPDLERHRSFLQLFPK